MNASHTQDGGDPPPITALPLHLTIYPDTDSDVVTEPMVIGMLPKLIEILPPKGDRTMMACPMCGEFSICFMARDHNQPQLLFGGSLCGNNNCSNAYITIMEDPLHGE